MADDPTGVRTACAGSCSLPGPAAGAAFAVRWSILVACCCATIIANPLLAADETGDAAAAKQPAPPPTVTHHQVDIDGELLEYEARAGKLDIAIDDQKTRGQIFFVAYTKKGKDAESRPLAFVFNGGPGAASVYLHLLALGPRLAVLGDDGTIPPPPVRIADNPSTWLAFTDLVFIDPVGTGYSRLDPDPDDASNEHGATDDSRFWSFEEDLDALAEFIRLHLTRTQRWQSPKFLVGESYGGFRAAALPKRLASNPGVRLNGIMMISPVLEFSLQAFDPYLLVPWATVLPAYGATALHHEKSTAQGRFHDVLAEIEAFAMGDYLTWLARPDRAADDGTIDRLVRYLGLPRDLVLRHRGRVGRTVFAKMLLRDDDRLVSLYDGTISGIDPDPSSPILNADDPVLETLTAPLTSAFNSYIREHLSFETDSPYLVLNSEVNRRWDWNSDTGGRRRQPGTAETLKEAMSLDTDLMVFIAHGAYDIVTPYLASKYIVRQMSLDPEIEGNVRFELYDGGHMPYTHAAARAALFEDARQFFLDAVSGPDER